MTPMDFSIVLFAALSVQAHNSVVYVAPYTIMIASCNGFVNRTRAVLVASTLMIRGRSLTHLRGIFLNFPKSKGAQILNALKPIPL